LAASTAHPSERIAPHAGVAPGFVLNWVDECNAPQPVEARGRDLTRDILTVLTIERLWQEADFSPNDGQRDAILHTEGPLYLPAGPGSGKTRVLLWRALNLIVFHDVSPDTIYLSTYTEKAARQLKEGLRALLGLASNFTGKPYDTSQMYMGTVHSLCGRILRDRRFYPDRQRGHAPVLLDELDQYFYLYDQRLWNGLAEAAGLDSNANRTVNAVLGSESTSRHHAVVNAIALFNRISEECLVPDRVLPICGEDADLAALVRIYSAYLNTLRPPDSASRTDFSLLQQEALRALGSHAAAGRVFTYVIVDEHQDTNTVQERLFFRLAEGTRNLCVVGDDDQALYRFRGAMVENFVLFPARCTTHFGIEPRTIPLVTNYRSRERIVDFYTRFIHQCNWSSSDGAHFRVQNKRIEAKGSDTDVAVVASTPAHPSVIVAEIADLVKRLIDAGKVNDPNQIAFLFPSLKATIVQPMKEALEARALRVYAPRAGRFLEVPEATAIFGLFLKIFGRPARGDFAGEDYRNYQEWLGDAQGRGESLCDSDRLLGRFVQDRQAEIATAVRDYESLSHVVERQIWSPDAPYEWDRMNRALYDAPGLSGGTCGKLGSRHWEGIVRYRAAEGRPFSLKYILTSVTALDWNVLDLFYRLCGFDEFWAMFDLAEQGGDEGPVCNLSLVSQYLARFLDRHGTVITARFLREEGLSRMLFASFLFALFRRGESEYENAEDPFPKGRIPFLTVHQAKGLEFPVVVLGSARKQVRRQPREVECIVHPWLDRESEPLERMSEFDAMRLFYVALSRAKNLLVIAHPSGRGQSINEPFRALLDDNFPRIPQFDVDGLPAASLEQRDTPHSYSYTGDYLFYQKCPRQYMTFRKYGFVPSRSQTQMFGSLVHQTLDDLHQLLIARRTSGHE
jgi:DNA helicase-2/ATP-dependent DNA helicase PcrA